MWGGIKQFGRRGGKGGGSFGWRVVRRGGKGGGGAGFCVHLGSLRPNILIPGSVASTSRDSILPNTFFWPLAECSRPKMATSASRTTNSLIALFEPWKMTFTLDDTRENERLRCLWVIGVLNLAISETDLATISQSCGFHLQHHMHLGCTWRQLNQTKFIWRQLNQIQGAQKLFNKSILDWSWWLPIAFHRKRPIRSCAWQWLGTNLNVLSLFLSQFFLPCAQSLDQVAGFTHSLRTFLVESSVQRLEIQNSKFQIENQKS